ncbi:unnamed protein product [Moneuplotes crassus]|uniref:Uncharacterized protein n=1 Tax=Euplotes crassus TaxID=5936 RepID=A0AAD1Y541_EUPCR|nr:unnamed protein product [Moneuplotes crassus]
MMQGIIIEGRLLKQPFTQPSKRQDRSQGFRAGNFGIHNNKTRYNYYRPNWDLNSRYEKSKYEPEEMRTSSISNEKSFQTYDTEQERCKTIATHDEGSPYLRSFQERRVDTYSYYPRRDEYRSSADLYSSAKKSREDDELSEKINSLKSCIQEIEKKQDILLTRIDSKIHSKPKFSYENETLQRNENVRPHANPLKKKKNVPGLMAKEIERKIKERSKIIKEKYSQDNPNGFREADRSQEREGHREMSKEHQTSHLNLDIPEDNHHESETMKLRDDSSDDFTRKKVLRSNQQFETNISFQKSKQQDSFQEGKDEGESPEKSLSPSRNTLKYYTNSQDDIEEAISNRKKKIEESRKDRKSRLSYTTRSMGSDSQCTFSNSKNLFMSSTKPLNKYELVNDSFGSPENKINKAKMKYQQDDTDAERERRDNNDHIITQLEIQERKLECFVPPSRQEPVPITLEQTDLPMAYESSPDLISFQYENTTSPPRCTKTRKKLFHSPTHKKELKEDTHPDYNCNSDTLSAMRAKDLHCGRGSSPLRTKMKSPKRNKSRSPSPSKKGGAKIEYYYDNGTININTPVKTQLDFERAEETTPKSSLISKLKESNKSFKEFKRANKAAYEGFSGIYESSSEKCDDWEISPEVERHRERLSSIMRMKEPARTPQNRTKIEHCGRNEGETRNAATKIRPHSAAMNTARSKKLQSEARMMQVRKRKEEIFKKRQEELQAKLLKKEYKRKLLSQNNWGYTPKLRESSPLKHDIVTSDHYNITEGSTEKQEWHK